MSCESGNTAQRGGVASAHSGTQARRQTLSHSASNELPAASTSSSSSVAEKSTREPQTFRFFEYLPGQLTWFFFWFKYRSQSHSSPLQTSIIDDDRIAEYFNSK